MPAGVTLGTTITDIRVPADQFPLGRILKECPDVEIELERIVPTREEVVPLFWAESGAEREVEETLRTDPPPASRGTKDDDSSPME